MEDIALWVKKIMMIGMAYDFSGKVALVTGASRGLGAEIARGLDRYGARCVVNYVADAEGKNKADADAVAAGLKNALVLEASVTDLEQVEAMFGKIQKECGGLDVLVNNAGVIKDRTLKKMTWDEWNAVIQVNLSGTFNCLKAATGAMREGGRIVNIASVAGQAGLFGQANYGASKAGVIGLTKVAAKEFARSQVTVNAVAPGFLNGGMSMDLQPEIKAKFEEKILLGRFGELSEIVETVLFLCSADAGYITGQTLGVNGGFYMN